MEDWVGGLGLFFVGLTEPLQYEKPWRVGLSRRALILPKRHGPQHVAARPDDGDEMLVMVFVCLR